MKDNNLKQNASQMQLIVINRNGDLQYYDKFRLRLHGINEQLIIMPSENEEEFIHITFKRNFAHQNLHPRIICIDECEKDSNKYLLIFNNDEKCLRFIESVKNSKAKRKLLFTVSKDSEILKSKYLTLIAKKCQENPVMEEKLKQFLCEFCSFNDSPAEKETDIPFVVEEIISNYDSFVTQNASKTDKQFMKDRKTDATSQIGKESIERGKSLRKRPKKISHQQSSEISKCHVPDNCYQENEPPKYKRSRLSESNDNSPTPNFKLLHFIKHGKSTTRLCVFLESDKTMCYEYYVDHKQFVCSGCKKVRKNSYAIVEKDSNGVDCVKVLQTEHFCTPRKFQSENYQSDLVIKKPHFDVLEKEFRGKMMKYLLLYTSEDKKNFYQLTYSNSIKCYVCFKCAQNKSTYKKRINATIREDENSNEVVYIRNLKHLCSNMEYLEAEEATTAMKLKEIPINRSMIDPQISIQPKIFKKPNFQLFQRKVHGKMLNKLAIFDSNDSTLCYEFTWSNKNQLYTCNKCNYAFHKHVCAKVIKNENEEEYVQMGKNDHLCELKKFEL